MFPLSGLATALDSELLVGYRCIKIICCSLITPPPIPLSNARHERNRRLMASWHDK